MRERVPHRYASRAVRPVVAPRAPLSEDDRLLGQGTIADRYERCTTDRALRKRTGILSLGVVDTDPESGDVNEQPPKPWPSDRCERLLPADLA